jgi:PAS domain S-box-containing protein
MREDKSAISILLVEPRGHSCPLVLDLLSENMPDYELDLAPSYAAALSMMQRRNYDVCLAPSRIGKHDTIDLLSELSKNEWKIPVIIITGSGGARIGDADTTGQTGAHPLIKDLFGGSFLEQHIRFAMERNRVESAVMRAKKEWEQIFDAVSDSIAIIDRNYMFQRVNRAMADRLGSKPADLIGRPCHEVMHGLSSPPDFCPMLPMLQDGQEHYAEIFQEDLKGVVLVSVSPFLDGENNLAGGIVVARDITRLKKIEQELREANENLEQHVKMRTSELAQKAKDLEDSNTALRVILRHREEDRNEIRESLTYNIRELVFPHLDQMEYNIQSKEQLNVRIREIRSILDTVISPFPRFLSDTGLSPAEVRIAEMIRAGKSNKEIADLLSISDGTVRVHRERIRKKLGLTNQKTNLQTYLRSLR